MPDRRFEDKVSAEDLLKKPPKEIQIMTYIQVVKTNGQVIQNTKDIKEKIGWKLFSCITGMIAFIIIIFEVFQ